MYSITYRLPLAMFALAASVAVTHAQTPTPQASGGPVPGASPRPGMMMPGAHVRGGHPGAMGSDMGHMMAERGGMGMPFEHVEGRIAYIKAELKVTDAQSAPWDAFADTMRADATAMKSMRDGILGSGMPATMPDRMAAQRKMMSARLDMMDRSEASTKALYAVLSEDQRKEFDQIMPGPMGMM